MPFLHIVQIITLDGRDCGELFAALREVDNSGKTQMVLTRRVNSVMVEIAEQFRKTKGMGLWFELVSRLNRALKKSGDE